MKLDDDLEDLFAEHARSRRIERVTIAPARARLVTAPLFVAAVAATALALIVAYEQLGPRSPIASAPSASPTRSANVIASPSPTAAPTVTPAPSATPSPSLAGTVRYTSILGYAVDLPVPWHRSACTPLTQSSQPGGDVFVPVPVRDEAGSDVGSLYPQVVVQVQDNPRGLTPRQWAEQDPTGTAGQRIEDVTYAGRPAARKTIPSTSVGTYYVANGGRMFVAAPFWFRDTSSQYESAIAAILDSFRFVSDAERDAARRALPTAAPPRTPEQVADGLAAAFAAKDVDAVAKLLGPCPFTGGENAGASSVSREKYIDDLRTAFASGLVVTVQPRPLTDLDADHKTIQSTWRDARGTRERKLVIRHGENDRWEWVGTIERFQ